ncbi:MAG: GNAT family N-acetyltransferase [Paludibacter sp.]
MIQIRKTALHESEQLKPIFDYARQLMRLSGNYQQWTNGYPTEEQIEADIVSGNSYVCIENNEIIATFYFRIGEDATYNYIENGAWLNNEPYAVIHRLATNGKVKGVGSYVLNWCFLQHSNIRIDTHADNIIMHSLLLKAGYTRCGTIYLANGDARIAYHKCTDSAL